MPRETKAQKNARISLLLADYDARNAEIRKLEKIVAGLKEQIKELPEGAYGDWALSFAAPREIMDQSAVKRDYTERGVQMPVKLTSPSVVVKPTAGK